MPFHFVKLGSEKPAAVAGSDLAQKCVYVRRESGLLAGRVDRVESGRAFVKLALPNREGILAVTDTEFECALDEMEVIDAVMKTQAVKRFDANLSLTLEDGKSPTAIKDGDRIVDYLNVAFEGYASTFKGTTESDRDGDYVLETAFAETLPDFRKNPVMLTDHDNEVCDISGSYTKIGVDKRGLYVRGSLSNSPVPSMVHKRFLIVEGHLKTLSIGGYFFYAPDGRGIEKVRLYEISLVAVPANPDAIFTSRAVTLEDAKQCMKLWTARRN